VAALERMSEAENKEVRSFFTRVDPTDDEIARIVDIVVSRGGLESAGDVAARYADVARESLRRLPEGPATDALLGAITYAVDRRR
jgi:geranylgeranyl pyrophosphate synthase